MPQEKWHQLGINSTSQHPVKDTLRRVKPIDNGVKDTDNAVKYQSISVAYAGRADNRTDISVAYADSAQNRTRSHVKQSARADNRIARAVKGVRTANRQLPTASVSLQGCRSTGHYPDVAVIEEAWRHGIPAVWTPEDAEAPESEAESLSGAPPWGRGARAPVRMPRIVRRELPKERWVEIRHDDGRLVTVIEIASPANRGSRRLEYLTKRADYLAAGVNVVEIDLLRSGRRLLDMTEEQLRDEFGPAEETYFISATRSFDPDRLEVYACPLREPLPCIHIPLRYPDLDVPLDIQGLVNRCYETGRYWKLVHRRRIRGTPVPSETARLAR